MAAYEVDPSRWAYKLAPQLTGMAQQAYAALDPDEAQSYPAVKVAILRRYNINDETYRQRFRGLKPKAGQTPTQITTILTDLAGKWLKDCKSVDEVKDAVVKEQLMTTLPQEVRVWVTERQPRKPENWPKTTNKLARRVLFLLIPLTANLQVRVPAAATMVIGRATARPIPNLNRTPWVPLTALAHLCRADSKALCSLSPVQADCHQKTFKDILIDTGDNTTLVRDDLVSPKDLRDKKITIRCAHGDSVSYPLAKVKITLGGRDIVAESAVASRPPVAALLGWNIPNLMAFVKPQQVSDALASVAPSNPDSVEPTQRTSDEGLQEV